MASGFDIAGRAIGETSPPYVVAEMSGNHGGSLERALRMIEVAARCGADAIKFQSYTPDTITLDSDAPEFVVDNPLWRGKTLYQLYTEAHTPFAWHEALFAKAREVGITAFSSPFDTSAVALLESLATPAYKIASSELVDVNLIAAVAATGKPLILSTGMATFAEIGEAIAAVEAAGNRQLCLLHCVAGYPTPADQANLNTLAALGQFGYPVGLSDHSSGVAVAAAAVAMGAVMVEKHFCLSRDGAVDSDFSLLPDELADLVTACRRVFALRGSVVDGATASEADSVRFRRSLYAVADIAAGDTFTEHNVRSIRPANGLHPRHLKTLLGKTSRRALPRGTPLGEQDLDGEQGLEDAPGSS